MDTIHTSHQRLNPCKDCNKYWKNDAYCPHSFDDDKLWNLKKRSIKIRFSLIDGKEKTEFFDKKNNLIGEHIEPSQKTGLE
jgi:hypothetical protein